MADDILIKRLRQLNAADINAVNVYTELVALCPDEDTKKTLQSILDDEYRHVKMGKELLQILEKNNRE